MIVDQFYAKKTWGLQNDCDTGVEAIYLFAGHAATLTFLSQFTGEFYFLYICGYSRTFQIYKCIRINIQSYL